MHYLLLRGEETTLAQATANADLVQRGLTAAGVSTLQLLSQLPTQRGSTSLLRAEDRWFTTSLAVGRDDLPAELRQAVLAEQPSRQRIMVDGEPMLVVGVPLSRSGDAYFEVFPLQDLDRALRILGLILTLATLAAPIAAVPLGWWVTRPALRPLHRVAAAATAVAEGNLTARIDPGADPELARIAASFNETVAALEQRVRRDARFASDRSHELRSPLTTMVNVVALAETHRNRLPDEGKEALDLLRAEMDRFRRLVQDLLEISRADADDTGLALEDVRLAELVHRSLPPRLRPRLVVAPEANTVVVRADKRRLERVVANLVDNAEQHGAGLTAVRVDAAPHAMHLSVDDSGPGVTEAEREHIFERFARGQGRTRTSSDGAGLGLSLVARHVQLMGGTVQVTDSPTGGARFTVKLPAKEWR